MKKIYLPLILLLIYSCSSTNSTSKSDAGLSTTNASATTSERDGSSYEKAIKIKASNETNGVNAEYARIAKMYPGYRVKSQASGNKNGMQYDRISIITANGEEKVIYFDITNFYGKF